MFSGIFYSMVLAQLGGVLFFQVCIAAPVMQMIDQLPSEQNWRLVDTRKHSQCIERTLDNGLCFSLDKVLSQHSRLPSIRDITWWLGTFDLNGSETLVVAGNSSRKRDFIAGLLYLAGQRKIFILRPPIARLLALKSLKTSAGKPSAMSRSRIYTEPSRAEQIVLKYELRQWFVDKKPMRLLDARSEAEYWGENIRSYRGGHIPGAEHWPGAKRELLMKAKKDINNIVYAHDAFESLLFFVRAQVDTERHFLVYISGWVKWAMDSSLPVDSESYRDFSS